MYIYFRAEGQSLKRVDNESVAANSKGFLFAKFDVGLDWDGLALKAVFEQNRKSWSQILVEGICLVPIEVLSAGKFKVWLEGIDSDAVVRATTHSVKVEVLEGPPADNENAPAPTASEIEQLITIASKVRQDADNGVFNGADGKDGTSGADGKDGTSFEVFSDLDSLEQYPTTTTATAVRFIWAGEDAKYAWRDVTASLKKYGVYDGIIWRTGNIRVFKTITEVIVLSGDVDEDSIKQIVDNYLAEKPIEGGMTEEQAQQLNKNTEDIADLQENKAGKDEIPKTLPASDVYDWAKAETKPVYTAADVGADAEGTAASNVTVHNTAANAHSDIRKAVTDAKNSLSFHNLAPDAHNDIRSLITELKNRLNAIADSEDVDLDQLSELVKYIKDNRDLINQITTGKVSVSDIVDDLVTNASNKPLSASQGVELKRIIDAITVPENLSDLKDDATHRTVTDEEKTAWNAKSNFSGAYADLTGKPTIPTVPSDISKFNNDAGYLKGTELDAAIDTALAEAKASGAFDGEGGRDGYTPVKGVDYYTEAEKTEWRDYIATELAKRGQLKPEFANNLEELEESGDTTKLYVLPDGYIYAYMKTEVEVDSGTKPAFTNLKDQCTFYYQQRCNSSGSFVANANGTAVVIPVPVGETHIDLRVKGLAKFDSSYTAVYGSTQTPFVKETELSAHTKPSLDADGILNYSSDKTSATKYIVINMAATQESDFDDVIITINEPIEYTSGTETIVTEAFANTGLAFIPADYEDRIIELEEKAKVIPENTRRIEVLENKVGTVDEIAIVNSTIGATFPPSQKPAQAEFEGYDIDIHDSMADDVYLYIDEAVSGKSTVTKETLGKDTSGKYDIVRYTYAHREHIAWCRENYPKMYAWKNGSTTVYSVSVSPRKGDTLYSTPYIGTAYGTVSDVSAVNRSRTSNGVEFVKHESGDVNPTVIYTDKDDRRSSNASIMHEGVTYNRYPLGDLGANKKKLLSVFIFANEHGVMGKDVYDETKMCALVASRILIDFAHERQENNPLFKWMRDNCMLIIVPVTNPFGFNYNLTTDTNTGDSGYNNVNNRNINRNYDTPGWKTSSGGYVGSESETQYIMNTMVESDAKVSMSLHGVQGNSNSANRGKCFYQGQQPDGTGYNEEKLAKVDAFMFSNYGYRLYNYDEGVAENMPDAWAKSPSYITQCGAYGGIIEFCPADSDKSLEGFVHEMKQKVIENAYAQTINLTAMWLSDYLEG